jgi:hypothetical protein
MCVGRPEVEAGEASFDESGLGDHGGLGRDEGGLI